MIRKFLICTILFFLTAEGEAVEYSNLGINQQFVQERASAQLLTLKIILSKLKDLVISLKDIEELERVGLPHSDVVLMQETLLAKINETKLHALYLIKKL